ncbi:MAG TPA: bifunctional folylpolyglutamate synthase/dihydrofolate synthase [Rhodospirillales bacterium]|nr:bifunctional folylpolyglutamate synthase/dihydrofolate synthase [Rhodospirillales bacterium]
MTSFTSELILARLQALHPKSIDLSLGRIRRLLARLGHPERRLPPVVHIAGTNGKGSTLAMLDAMLTAAGRQVHRYISPHLVRFNERILLAGAPIDEALLADVLDECERANAGGPITFFEITTAAAFLAFSRVPADVLLLETGLGGRLDATNVVPAPRLTLMSPVSLDHEAHLGRTLAAIAAEKAGIVKAGVPLLCGPQQEEVLGVLRARCRTVGAPLRIAGRDWMVEPREDGLLYREGTVRLELPRPALVGPHQLDNAGLALAAARALGDLAPPAPALAEGLRRARWPARLQRLAEGPLPALLPPGCELWLDGGHNPAAGEVLARSLPELARGRPVHLVLGMLRTKDLRAFARPLARVAASAVAVPVPDDPLSQDPIEMVRELGGLGIPARPASGVAEALAELAHGLTSPALVLITGSLYLAGTVLRANG